MWTPRDPHRLELVGCGVGSDGEVAHVVLQARVAFAPLAQPVERSEHNVDREPKAEEKKGDAPAVSGGGAQRRHSARARRGCTLGGNGAKPLVVCDDAGAKAEEVECGKADREHEVRQAEQRGRLVCAARSVGEACVGWAAPTTRPPGARRAGRGRAGVRASPARA